MAGGLQGIRADRQESTDRPAPGQPHGAHGERSHGLIDRMPLCNFAQSNALGRNLSAPAAIQPGGGGNSHKVPRHDRLIAAEACHDFSDDLPNQPGIIALVGIDGGVEPFRFIDFRNLHAKGNSRDRQQ